MRAASSWPSASASSASAARGRRSSGTALAAGRQRRSPTATAAARRVLLAERRGVAARARPFEQQRAPMRVPPQQPYRAVAVPERERVPSSSASSSSARRHLQHRILARPARRTSTGRARRAARARAPTPRRHVVRRPGERGRVGDLAQLSGAARRASPCPVRRRRTSSRARSSRRASRGRSAACS